MIKKSSNFIFGIVKSPLFFVFLSILIISVAKTSSVDAKPKGINIIKYEHSSMSAPSYLYKDEIGVLMDKLNNATTEAEKTLIYGQLKEIEDEILAWYKDHEDIEKEEEINEKLELLSEMIIENISTKEGKEKLKETLPFTSIGYDYISHSLEVAIDPKQFSDKKIKKYIKYIRKIVGDEIDLTISRNGYAKKSNSGPLLACDPVIGGNKITTSLGSCTVGFKAKYQQKIGFFVAGHCVDGIGKNVGQPTLLQKLGKSTFNSDDSDFTTCDCAFIEITEDQGIDPKVFAAGSGFHTVTGTAFPGIGRMVMQYGVVTRARCGSIISQPFLETFDDGSTIGGLAATDIQVAAGGDSGGPVLTANGTKLLGSIQGWHEEDGDVTRTFFTKASIIRLKLGSTFSWEFN